MATLNLDRPLLPRGVDLPYSDGEPLESDWHVAAMGLLIEILRYHYRNRSDRCVAGNMFVYFDPDQAKTRNFRGPDLFVVKGTRGGHFRKSWVVWEENNLTPDYVVELASESTKAFDVGGKKTIYERELKTPEYVVYDSATDVLRGWRLNVQGRYDELECDERGWLWSEQLQLWLGVMPYAFKHDVTLNALRFFDVQGQLLLTKAEAAIQRAEAEARRAQTEAQHAVAEAQRADTEAQRAEVEAQHAAVETQRADTEARRADTEAQRAQVESARADAAEAELARLRAEFSKKT